MKHSLFAAARAAPLHGLLASAALHALAAPDAETAPALAPAATDLDTGQPLVIGLTALDYDYTGKKHARRDSAGPPIGMTRGQHMVGSVHEAQGGGYHRRREVALN